MSVRGFLALGLLAGLFVVLPGMASAAPNRSLATRTKRSHTIEGIVVAVKHDKKTPGSGHIRIRRVHHRHHRTNGQAAAAARAAVNAGQKRAHHSHMKFNVNKSTRFEHIVSGNKGKQVTQASFSSIHKGERVRIHPSPKHKHHAREVDILSHHRKHRSTSTAGRHRHYGNSLVRSRVQHPRSSTGRPNNVAMRKPAVRHPLIAGQVAMRNAQQAAKLNKQRTLAKMQLAKQQVLKKTSSRPTPAVKKPAPKPKPAQHAKPKKR